MHCNGQISDAVNDLSSGVQDVVNMNEDIVLKVQEADKSSKNTDVILSFIQAISSKTNMLGLNAAIEVATLQEIVASLEKLNSTAEMMGNLAEKI